MNLLLWMLRLRRLFRLKFLLQRVVIWYLEKIRQMVRSFAGITPYSLVYELGCLESGTSKSSTFASASSDQVIRSVSQWSAGSLEQAKRKTTFIELIVLSLSKQNTLSTLSVIMCMLLKLYANLEDYVVAGASAGAIKLWDLEQAKSCNSYSNGPNFDLSRACIKS